MNDKQKKKRSFRNSKKWKDFRHQKNVEQKGIDPITQKKLRKGCNLHHLLLSADDYEDITHTENFVLLNKKTHDTLHFLYEYYVNDKEILERLKTYLEIMTSLNTI